jgi:hypothetical protein
MKMAKACFLLIISLAFLSICSAEDSYIWDFGQVKQGEIASHDFTLKNDSGKTLNVTNVSTSCGCTASAIEKKVLAPGESAKISVKFNSKGYNGPVQQFVYASTDKSLDPIIKFTIKADVIK